MKIKFLVICIRIEDGLVGKRISGLINKMLVGAEKSEDFARNSLPSNRWELFFDIFKGSFWKIVLVNLLILLFLIPLVVLVYVRINVAKGFGSVYPFAQGFGVGYQAPISMKGFLENIAFSSNMMVYLFLPIVMLIGAVGISGGAYVLRNMVWTEGVFVANDFWKGIKQNYKQIVIISLIYSLVFYMTTLSASMAQYSIVVGAQMVWLYYVLEILSYIILGYFTLMTMFMITMAVTYEMTIKQLFVNSFYFVIMFLPSSIFFFAVAILPIVIFLLSMSISMLLMIMSLVVLLFGFSYMLLVWTNFSQWTFDKVLNDRIPGAKKNRGMYEKIKAEGINKTLSQYKVISRNSLNSRPIKPITDEEIQISELPEVFSREDLYKLKQSKELMYEDNKKYIEEHANDEKYQLTEQEKKDIEESKARAKRIEEAKKALKKHEKYNKK